MGFLGGLLAGKVVEVIAGAVKGAVKGAVRGVAGTARATRDAGRAVFHTANGKKTYIGAILGVIVVTMELVGLDVPGVEAVDKNWLAMYLGLGLIAALRHGIQKLG